MDIRQPCTLWDWGFSWIFICTIGSLSLSFALCCTFGTKEGAAASRAAALLLPTDEDDDDAPLEHMLLLLCGQRSGNQTMPANPELLCVPRNHFLVHRSKRQRTAA